MKSMPLKVTVLTASLVVSVLAMEGFLRLVAPRYQYAAESDFELDTFRILTRRPNIRRLRRHPDTGERHAVIYNNLAMRQHRTVSSEKSPGEIRIGIFGDSYTENLRLEASHGYTEVLDYLLNLHDGTYTVLNFGVEGYGPDQSYLYYRASPLARQLDAVIFQFCQNDLGDLYENDLFELSPDGGLLRKPAAGVPWWTSVVSRLYLTYAVLDLRARLDIADPSKDELRDAIGRAVSQAYRKRRHSDAAKEFQHAVRRSAARGNVSVRVATYVELLRRILGTWRDEVEASGASFRVLLLPNSGEARMRPLFAGFELVDLFREFSGYPIGPNQLFFERDAHWNELANRLAAVHLYRHLARELGLDPLDDDSLRKALYAYYRTFEAPAAGEFWTEPTVVPSDLMEAIRTRYSELEQ